MSSLQGRRDPLSGELLGINAPQWFSWLPVNLLTSQLNIQYSWYFPPPLSQAFPMQSFATLNFAYLEISTYVYHKLRVPSTFNYLRLSLHIPQYVSSPSPSQVLLYVKNFLDLKPEYIWSLNMNDIWSVTINSTLWKLYQSWIPLSCKIQVGS